MRRRRERSITIYAENKQDFMKQCSEAETHLSKKTFKKEEQDKIPEDDNDDLSYQKKKDNNFNNNDQEDDDFSDLGATSNEDDEDFLGPSYKKDEDNSNEEYDINKKENIEEKGIEILISNLKNTLLDEVKNMNLKSNTLIFNKKKNLKSMSNNAIYDLSIRELVDNFLAENDNEYIKSSEGNKNILKDYIFQNMESDSNLKIMIMSNNRNTQKSFMSKFFEIKIKITSDINEIKEMEDEDLDNTYDIKKKQIKLFNKNICLQMFDTTDDFHKNQNLVTKVFYENVSAFFIFIESSNHNVESYLSFIFDTINKYIKDRTVVIFGINLLYKENCTIDNYNLKEFAKDKNAIFFPIKINDFDMKNRSFKNLLELILITGISYKKNTSKRKDSKDQKIGGIANKYKEKINKESNNKKNIYDLNKMNIPNRLAFNKNYKMLHITAFDLTEEEKKPKRKISWNS